MLSQLLKTKAFKIPFDNKVIVFHQHNTTTQYSLINPKINEEIVLTLLYNWEIRSIHFELNGKKNGTEIEFFPFKPNISIFQQKNDITTDTLQFNKNNQLELFGYKGNATKYKIYFHVK